MVSRHIPIQSEETHFFSRGCARFPALYTGCMGFLLRYDWLILFNVIVWLLLFLQSFLTFLSHQNWYELFSCIILLAFCLNSIKVRQNDKTLALHPLQDRYAVYFMTYVKLASPWCWRRICLLVSVRVIVSFSTCLILRPESGNTGHIRWFKVFSKQPDTSRYFQFIYHVIRLMFSLSSGFPGS